MRLFFAVGLWSILFCTINGHIFPNQQEIVYNYDALVQATVQTPVLYTSKFLINAKVHLTGTENGVVATLRDITHGVHAGKDVDVKNDFVKEDLPMESKVLTDPFVIKYDSTGKVIGILADKNDKLWSINIKKGIASLLQFDMNQIEMKNTKNYGFYTDEHTVHGMCHVLYTVDHANEKNIKVTKRYGTSSCTEFKLDTYLNLSHRYCGDRSEESMVDSTERFYDIDTSNNQFIINRVEGYSNIIFNPFTVDSDTHTIVVNQVLNKLSMKKATDVLKIDYRDMHEHKIKVDVVDKNSVQEIYDLTGGRQVINQDLVTSKTKTYLKNLLYQMKDMVKITTSVVEQKDNLNYLIQQLKVMDLNALKHFHTILIEDNGEDARKIVDLFYQTLPYAGTHTTSFFILDLIKENKIKDEVTNKIVQDMPFFLKNPHKTLLREFFNFVKDSKDISNKIKRSFVLAFASLVTKAVHLYGENDEDVKTYVKFYLDKIKEASDYKQQKLYFYALKNIKTNKVFEILDSVMKNVTGGFIHDITPHSRIFAMWATLERNSQYPGRINKIYWPILVDRKESLEVRISALQILMWTGTMEDHLKIYSYMHRSTDEDLYNSYYATLQSLAKSTITCHSFKTQYAKKILHFVRKPVNSQMTVFNHLSNFFDIYHGFGVLSSIRVTGDLIKHGFLSIYAATAPQITNLNIGMRSLYIYVKLSQSLKQTLQHKTEMRTFEDVQRLLKPDDVIVEFVHLRNNQVVLETQHNFDIKNIDDIVHEIDNTLKKSNKDVNFVVDQVARGEIFMPTDTGLPVSLFVRMHAVKKSNSEFNYGQNTDKTMLMTNIKYDNVWGYNQRFGLAVYNPVTDSWHGCSRTHLLTVNIPLSVGVEFDVRQNHFKINLMNTKEEELVDSGFVSHVHSDVFMYTNGNSDLLKKMCNNCQGVTVVTKGESYREQHNILDDKETSGKHKYAFFDCERQVSTVLQTNLKNIFNNIDDKKIENLALKKLLVATKHWQEFDIFSREHGMCGISYLPVSAYKTNHYIDSYNYNQNKYQNYDTSVETTQKVDLYTTSTCEIGNDYVVNIHGSHFPYKLTNSWKMIAGNCKGTCKWQLFVKTDTKNRLATRFTMDKDTLEVYPRMGYEVIYNGKMLKHHETSYNNDSFFKYKILNKERVMVLEFKNLNVQVYHYGKYITLRVPTNLHDGLCYETYHN